jgi:hypothetical protein
LFYCYYTHLGSAGEFPVDLVYNSFCLHPLARWRRCVVRAAYIAKIQYFCDSKLDWMRLLKLISSENRLLAGTSSGASPARDSSSRAISSALLLWREPFLLSWREKLRNIHWECVMWRIFEMNCFAQSALLRKLLVIAKWKFCIS